MLLDHVRYPRNGGRCGNTTKHAATEGAILTLAINLDRSVERLAALQAQFDRSGRTFDRFSAIEPSEVDTHPEFDNRRFRSLHNRAIRKGELGCALSHKRCLEKFLTSREEHCLIFEDDVSFDDNTFPTIDATMAWLAAHPNERWHCVNLSSTYRRRFRDLAEIRGRRLRRSWQFPLLTSALLWNRDGAKTFLDHLNAKLIHTPIDNQLRLMLSRSGFGLSFEKPPVGLGHFESVIAPEVGSGANFRSMRNSWYDLRRRLPVYGWAIWNNFRC